MFAQFSITRGRCRSDLSGGGARLERDATAPAHGRTASSRGRCGVTAYFCDRTGSPIARPAQGAILVGADGIHSAVAMCVPSEGPARWNGIMLCARTVDWPAVLRPLDDHRGRLAEEIRLYSDRRRLRAKTAATNWAVTGKVGRTIRPPPRQGGNGRSPPAGEDLGPHLKRFNLPSSKSATDRGRPASYGNSDVRPRSADRDGRANGTAVTLSASRAPDVSGGSNGASQRFWTARPSLADLWCAAEHPLTCERRL